MIVRNHEVACTQLCLMEARGGSGKRMHPHETREVELVSQAKGANLTQWWDLFQLDPSNRARLSPLPLLSTLNDLEKMVEVVEEKRGGGGEEEEEAGMGGKGGGKRKMVKNIK